MTTEKEMMKMMMTDVHLSETFNIIMEKVIQISKVRNSGTIYRKASVRLRRDNLKSQ